MSEYLFANHNLTNSQRAAAEVFLHTEKEKYSKPLDGEKAKTAEQISVIELAVKHYQQELVMLGLRSVIDLSVDQVHLLEEEVYKRHTDSSTSAGFYHSAKQAMFVNLAKNNSPLDLYTTTVHEAGHKMGYQKFFILFSERTNAVDEVLVYRTGYGILHPEGYHEHFREFNEGVNDNITVDVARRNQAEIMGKLGAELDKFWRIESYFGARDIVKVIVRGLSSYSQVDEDQVWTIIKRGQFTGAMLDLSLIDKAFGCGSLRVLGALIKGLKAGSSGVRRQQVYEYFISNNPQDRHNTAMQILNERERFRYLNRRKNSGV